jgi:hypothetical protein
MMAQSTVFMTFSTEWRYLAMLSFINTAIDAMVYAFDYGQQVVKCKHTMTSYDLARAELKTKYKTYSETGMIKWWHEQETLIKAHKDYHAPFMRYMRKYNIDSAGEGFSIANVREYAV